MSECTECDPRILRLSARLARREARQAARLERKGDRSKRRTARAIARASGCPTFLGLPWEQVEGFIAMAISHFDGAIDDLDPHLIARHAWKLIRQTGIIPRNLTGNPVAELAIEFVLIPMAAKAIESALEWKKAKTKKAREALLGKLEALAAQPEDEGDGEE